MRQPVCAAILALGWLSAGGARAEPQDPAAAEALFQQAREAQGRGDLKTACPKFAESQRLDPAAGTLLNLADCEEQLGKLASSWQHWQEVVAMLPAGDDRRALASQRLAKIEKRVPRLTLRMANKAPAGARITRDAIEFGSASLGTPLPIDPGSHEVVVTAPGHEPRRQVFSIAEAEEKNLTLEAGPAIAPQPRGQETPKAAASGPSSGPSVRRVIGFVSAGVGLVGLGGAVVTAALLPAQKKIVEENCNATSRLCKNEQGRLAAEAGQRLLNVNTASWILGLTGVAAGAALILTSLGDPQPKATIRATALPGGAGASISGNF